MSFVARVATAVLVLSLGSQTLVSQTVSGRLLDGLGRLPIDRAFIVLLDESGEELARVLTDAQGGFSTTAPGAGRYRLRSERIGFIAGHSDWFQLAESGTHEIEMVVDAVVIRLDTIRVSGDSRRCRVVGDQGMETATVWEEARKALTGVAWGESRQILTYEIRYFNRYYEDNGRFDHEESSTTRRSRVMPYTTPTAEELQERGYVLEIGEREDSSVYDAPDARVFFSETFLQHHCFRLERDRDYVGLVGLAFEPTRGRGVPDVEGTLWLDEESAELRRLDLRYTDLRSHLRRRHARAAVEFERLENGTWFVQRWSIRMPIVRVETPRVGGFSRRTEHLDGFLEEGSEVLKVVDRSGEVLFEAEASSHNDRLSAAVFLRFNAFFR